jgi:two-component system, OmpR family, response regulator TctD
MNLLLVEDDPSMCATLDRALSRRGMRITVCADGGQALARWRGCAPDVVLLDLSLPGMDGLDVLEHARAEGLRTPVLVLTARGTVGDRILGLNAGADDYLPKPFDLDELEARVRALGRRPPTPDAGHPAPKPQPAPGAPFRMGRLRFDADNGVFYAGSEVFEITPRESALLRALAVRPGHALAKEKLFDAVFPGDLDVQYDAVEVVVYRLRKKLAGTGVQLVTLRGLGYLLKAE